ncbi:MAG: Flp family type IVb pilin [Gammaproteobacteria bacterium]|jgi:pilus assembly protein Flp/PilA
MAWRFLREESGATVVEYAVLAAFLSIAAITTIVVIGRDVDAKFNALLALLPDGR